MAKVKQLGPRRFHIETSVMYEVDIWLRENITIERYASSSSDRKDRPPSMIIWFLEDVDAMAFKLRWL